MCWYIPMYIHSDPSTHTTPPICTDTHTFIIAQIYTHTMAAAGNRLGGKEHPVRMPWGDAGEQ